MDRSGQQPQQRDMVFCHECENEWYRDEHGLTCPECQSDFTEIIEANHDPREDNNRIPAEQPGSNVLPQHGEFYGAPDPDEEDIEGVQWRQTGPGTFRGSINRTIDIDPRQLVQQQQQGQGQAQGGLLGGIMGALGNVLSAAIAPAQQQQQGQHPGEQYAQAVGADQRPLSPDSGGDNRSASASGSPRGTTVRHWHGPNFHMTMMTSSNAGGGALGAGQGNLFPRNTNAPQPLQQQPDYMEQMLTQMFMNVGGAHGGMRVGGPGMAMAGPPGMGPAGGLGTFGDIFQMLGMQPGPGGQMGDYVFDQAGMDRIMTELMARNQAGNAPGPAPEAAIDSLPTRKLEEKDFGDNGKAECTICMDEVEMGTSVTELPCHHWFHFECIKAWLSEHDTCPHCRQGIMPKDEAATDRARQHNEPPRHDTHAAEYHGPAQMPGGFPQPLTPRDPSTRQVPDGSERYRRSSSTPGRPGSSRQGNSNGLFQNMRSAFGGGSNGSNYRNDGESGGNGGPPPGYS
ncbi:hypothetical protein LTR62_004339 [Meristemomyces frigidus]|uniref:RING-type E3 ubiquitin transferase n=1 Tax=Meristemomyces frigidus TaxID=1508187 RepID=A0AAN7TR03_9PEZI|nr:hypothetical protein LTR62_004339 [Meristemomyces frigidus]